MWNLFLAWVPLVFAWRCMFEHQKDSFGRGVILLFAHGGFFYQNAFYPITDFIHLRRTSQVDILFDIICSLRMRFVV